MSSPSKRKILAAAKDLFWKYGFKRVTVEEVAAEAGVSKMTFYKYFSNKMELVKVIIGNIMEESVSKYRDVMEQDIPFTKKVELQLQMKMEGTLDMSKEFVDDLIIHGDPDIMKYLAEMQQKVLHMVHQDYIQAQERGDIRSDIKPEFIIYFLNHFYEMLKDEKLLAMYATTNALAMELVRFFFYGVMERTNNHESN